MNVSLLNYTIHTYHSGTRFHCINPRSREGSDSKIAHIRNIFSGNYVNLV